ncbi:hypothetical protein Mar181_0167 [Marinomonas posidonica IVIA-Po-181]|uniref:Uncharacterized protein n=1 Tax=Marinomonas posidonica (strain CECT 7376 / NCIMB 14433 / IVIA-Po-181) TaxID=491952 RepID=F6CWI0_MARPP|nr:hypothetical protein Mar181_0167 [Marinomonas posidonica IVIA-Po-181]
MSGEVSADDNYSQQNDEMALLIIINIHFKQKKKPL